MTIEQAVAVLNANNHRRSSNPDAWYVVYNAEGRATARKDYWGASLEEFEAIAIAEKYQREATTPTEG